MSDAALGLDGISRVFVQGGTRLEVLHGVSLTLARGEIVGLVGPSGSGKSTLLHISGLLEYPDGGEVLIDGAACNALSDYARTRLRREHVGFVYQFHHLLPEFSAEENIMLPQMIAGVDRAKARECAHDLLAKLALEGRADHRPGRLSGGEQQRVAIARALANQPKVLLADEPTGNLDPATAEAVFDELLHLVRDSGVAALVATHNHDLAARMDRMLALEDGKVVAR